eukprot:Pompholyxophrys_sp_v1_NODE_9_length_5690_cov_16.428039.p3 type:complete len:130 gc:universal NODE_9_length_5690_cov_16.428039:1213-1602(+)
MHCSAYAMHIFSRDIYTQFKIMQVANNSRAIYAMNTANISTSFFSIPDEISMSALCIFAVIRVISRRPSAITFTWVVTIWTTVLPVILVHVQDRRLCREVCDTVENDQCTICVHTTNDKRYRIDVSIID